MRDAGLLVSTVFSGLSPLVVDDVADEGELIRVRARTPARPVGCPGCGAETARVHGYHELRRELGYFEGTGSWPAR